MNDAIRSLQGAIRPWAAGARRQSALPQPMRISEKIPILQSGAMTVLRFLSTVLLTLSGASAFASNTEDDVTSLLRGYDEALLEAVHRGDHATWDKLTTSDFSYIEAGEIMSKAQLLHAVEEDGKKPLAIRQYNVRRIGDTAIVIHEDQVQPGPMHTNRVGGRFLMTETWQRIDKDWKLRLVHIEPIRSNPPAVVLPSSQLDELAGTYRAGPDSLVIERVGDHLVGTRPNSAVIELRAETRDVFFTPGDTRMRRIFQRDPATGVVTGFIRRGENSDTLFSRSGSR